MNENNLNSLTVSSEALKQLVADTLQMARDQGASAAEAGLSVSEGLSVSARMRDVETIEYQNDTGLGISVYIGQHKGSASTSSLNPEALRKTVKAACDIARFTSQDPCAGLADAELMASEFRQLDQDHPWDLSSERAIELALECEAAALDLDARISNSDGASVDTTRSLSVYGNTHGFLAAERKTRHSLSCSVVAGKDDAMQRDYWYSVNRNPGLLEAARDIGHRAAERTLQRLGASKLDTGSAPVLFAPEVARGLFGHFTSAIGGNAQYRKASFLLDHKGQRVFPEFVQLTELPFERGALGSANYDGEGVATRDNQLVIDGVVQDYLLDSYSARKLGRRTTGHAGGVHNLVARDTGQDFAAMLALMDRGLLVTELMGHGVNTVTGDYSRGAAGFWVEQGKIQYPVEEITIAGNLKDMFRDIQAIGNDVDRRGKILCGSVLVGQMTIAGQG